jgi:formate transporter
MNTSDDGHSDSPNLPFGNHGVDALLPAEVARAAEDVGVRKAKADTFSLLALAILGGAFIALGAMFATTVMAGSEDSLPYGLGRLLAGVPFCLGLVLVLVGGAELFTGNALMVMAWAAGRLRLSEMLRAWLIVYLGNFIGAFGIAALVFLSGQYLFGRGAVARVALKLASDKALLPFSQALFLGILCNLLVCLAVWLSLGARTTSGKVLAIIFPVSAFVAAGFEHSVANMYLIPLGLLIKSWGPDEMWLQLGTSISDFATLTWPAFFYSLVPVTIGNIIGGAGLVGGVYWFIYLRNKGTA